MGSSAVGNMELNNVVTSHFSLTHSLPNTLSIDCLCASKAKTAHSDSHIKRWQVVWAVGKLRLVFALIATGQRLPEDLGFDTKVLFPVCCVAMLHLRQWTLFPLVSIRSCAWRLSMSAVLWACRRSGSAANFSPLLLYTQMLLLACSQATNQQASQKKHLGNNLWCSLFPELWKWGH